MFGRHVENSLPAYIHGELDPGSAERVRSHLAACARCRSVHAEMEFAAAALSRLPRCKAPDAVWARIEQQITAAGEPARISPRNRWSGWQPRLEWAALFIMLAVLLSTVTPSRRAETGGQAGAPATVGPGRENGEQTTAWTVEAVRGTPRVAEKELRGPGRLAQGEWLETDARSTARVHIADIGEANIRPNTRLSMVRSGVNQHRMRLERGELHAKVSAPPRLFIVDTPAATAVDLGCEYTLTANPDGASILRVRSGWVAMEFASQASYVPATMASITLPGQRPGTPFRQDGHPEFIAALKRFDSGSPSPADISELLKRARQVDGLTLWHLLDRVPPDRKKDVFLALDRLVPAPKEAAFQKVMDGDRDAMNAWKDRIEIVMFPSLGFTLTDLAVDVMRMQKKGSRK